MATGKHTIILLQYTNSLQSRAYMDFQGMISFRCNSLRYYYSCELSNAIYIGVSVAMDAIVKVILSYFNKYIFTVVIIFSRDSCMSIS